jgi:hypothetical protein
MQQHRKELCNPKWMTFETFWRTAEKNEAYRRAVPAW